MKGIKMSFTDDLSNDQIAAMRDEFYRLGWGQNTMLWKCFCQGADYASAKLTTDNTDLRMKLAEQQAQIKKMRKALNLCHNKITGFTTEPAIPTIEDAMETIGDSSELTKIIAEAEKRGEDKYSSWYYAVTDACVINYINWDEKDARKSLNTLLCCEIDMALDPKISKDAKDLIQRGRDERTL